MHNHQDKQKALIILSSQNYDAAQELESLVYKIESIEDEVLTYTCLVDPPQRKIEHLLYSDTYLCVIPCTQFSCINTSDKKNQVHGFNTIQLLQHLKVPYFGSSYVSNILVNDKATSLNVSNMYPPMSVITEYGLANIQKPPCFSDSLFSISLEPTYQNNFIPYHNSEEVFETWNEANVRIANMFKENQNLNEVLVKASPKEKRRLVVSIIGSPPNSIELICEVSSNQLLSKVDENVSTFLFARAVELFDLYKIKGFAQFEFIYCLNSKKTYLNSINVSNILNKNTIYCLKEAHDIEVKEALNILVIIFLASHENSVNHAELISLLAKGLSDQVIRKLLPLNLLKKAFGNYDYTDVCNELKKRFLHPDERNRKDFIKLIEKAIDQIPQIKKADSPYLGGPHSDYAFLNDFEEIPQEVKDCEQILNESVKIFEGQPRWHAPTALYNVFPPTMFNTIAAAALSNLYNPNLMTKNTSSGLLEMEEQLVRQFSSFIGWPAGSAGIFTPGGKACLIYAIKMGLNRCMTAQKSKGKPVVIASEINHYSIESNCSLVGLSTDSVKRIPVSENGTIDLSVFRAVLEEKAKNGVPIACIVFSGGNTMHCTTEDLVEAVAIINDVTKKYSLRYSPYVYYDTVIGWPWLFFKGYNFDLNSLKIGRYALHKIRFFYEKLSYAHLADGIGIDFHKGGFCPFGNSLFLTKSSQNLYSIFGNQTLTQFREPYHYSLNNSRGASAILAAWNMLQSTGIEGIRSYVANMMEVSSVFSKELPNYGFEVIRSENTYGFGTVIWCQPSEGKSTFSNHLGSNEEDIAKNNEYLYRLSDYLSEEKEESDHCQFVRYLPNYTESSNGVSVAVISILPMTMNIDKKRASIVSSNIGEGKKAFDDALQARGSFSQNSNSVVPQEIPR